MNLEKIVREWIKKNLIFYIKRTKDNICNEENRFFDPKGNA